MPTVDARRGSRSRAAVGLLAAAWLLPGCAADDSVGSPHIETLDASTDAQPLLDATIADGSHDATTAPDSAPDATLDAGTDATTDAEPDAIADTGTDAETDTGTDATTDAETDATSDAEPDASDAGVDAFVCGEGGPVGVFTDDFSQGVRPTYWKITQINPDAGVYTFTDDAGALQFTKVGPNPGGTQNITAWLDMAAVGGPVQGDFTMTVDFRDAVLGASPIDQIELHANFEDASYFFNVYSNEGGLEFHVWDGAFETGFATSVDAATLQIVRTGSTLTAYAIPYADGGSDAGARTVFTKTGSTTALKSASFILQNFNTNNAISVTYDNFALRGACVHP